MEQKIHPLLINHIVEQILEYQIQKCSTSLLTMRQVCQIWCNVATNSYRKYNEKLITFGNNCNGDKEMEEFLCLIKSRMVDEDLLPFGNFSLCSKIFQSKNLSLLQNLFEGCGYTLKCLVIRLDQQSTISITDNFLKSVELPKLKSLVFDDRRIASKAFDNLLIGLLTASHRSLESLSLQRKQIEVGYNQENDENLVENRLIEALEIISLKHLRTLKMEMKLDDKIIICLTKNFKSLNNLTLCLKTSKFQKSVLCEFFKGQENSLKILCLRGLHKKSDFHITFPKLQYLKCLELHGWCDLIPEMEFSPFLIQDTFPNLNSLILNTWSYNISWQQFLCINNALQSSCPIEKLKLPQALQDAELLKNISLGFGNLRSLELHYQPTMECVLTFRSLFENLQQIQELRILQSFSEINFSQNNIDFLLSGMSSQECERMLRINNFSSIISRTADEEIRLPSLINLKNLRFLDLTDVLKYQTIVSDVTGYTILTLGSLGRLKISRSKIRQNCFMQLYKRFPEDLSEEMDSYETYAKDENRDANRNCNIM